VGQLFASIGLITFDVKVEGTWKLLQVEGSPLNKLQGFFMRSKSNIYLASSKDDTFF
jgi:hypothetical protein